MADQLYLSYWIPGFTEHNMLRHYERMLALFPYSRLEQRISTFRIVAIDYAQPPGVERAKWQGRHERRRPAEVWTDNDGSCCAPESSRSE